MLIINPNKDTPISPESFFLNPTSHVHKHYEALRSFDIDKLPADKVAKTYGYKKSTLYSLTRDFKKTLNSDSTSPSFFITHSKGRKQKDASGTIKHLILALRKRYLSVPDIKSVLDVQGYNVSETYIYLILKKDGFDRLPRRNQWTKKQVSSKVTLKAPCAEPLCFENESFSVQNSLGLVCLLPYLEFYGMDKAMMNSDYPQTKIINRYASIMSFVILKLSDVRRYSADDAWCMDRGLGLPAKLNVLPKAAWFSSYSHRITTSMNRKFLTQLMTIWKNHHLLSDTRNIDFTTIPYWGDDAHLENNWSGTRNKGLASMLAVLGQDPDSGIITYGDTTIRHQTKNQVVLEFIDFEKRYTQKNSPLRYLVFDSKFTTYENLARLDPDVLFLTIRRRSQSILEDLKKQKASSWKTIRVMASDQKGRILQVYDHIIFLPAYGKDIRQIAIRGHGKIKPALLMTNDFESKTDVLVRKYARRWLVEKEISEQIEFFHLNRVSSSMVIKVDFDLTMSILAHNLLRLFARELPGYEQMTDLSLYTRFLNNSGSVEISSERVLVKLKKKRHLPAILNAMESFNDKPLALFDSRKLCIVGDSTS